MLASIPHKRLFLSALLIRLVLAPVSFHPWEWSTWINVINDLKHGVSPYLKFVLLSDLVSSRVVEGPGWSMYFEYWAYPPLWLLFLLPLVLLPLPSLDWGSFSGIAFITFSPDPVSSFFLKLPIIAFDLMAGWALWLIARIRFPEKAGLALKSWLFNPLVIFITAVWGHFDVAAVFFMLMSVYLFLSQRLVLSAIFLALGFSTKIFPVFLLPLFFLKLQGREKILWLFCFSFTSFIIFLPFLSRELLEAILIFHSERLGGGMTYWSFLWVAAEWLGLNRLKWGISLSTAYLPIMISVLLFFYLRFRNDTDIIRYSAIILLGVLVTSKLVNEPYSLWPLPFIILFWLSGEISEIKFKLYYSIPIAFAFIGVPITNFFKGVLIGNPWGERALAYFALPIPFRVLWLFLLGLSFSIVSLKIILTLKNQAGSRLSKDSARYNGWKSGFHILRSFL